MEEIYEFYQKTLRAWFEKGIDTPTHNQMLKALVDGNITLFKKLFSATVLQSFSYFDISGSQPEKFYHGFVLKMLISLRETHHVTSNRESGYGRYDVMIVPKNTKKIGIIIEFKTFDEDDGSWNEAANAALEQIKEKKYDTYLQSLGITEIIKLGIVFQGKQVLIKED